MIQNNKQKILVFRDKHFGRQINNEQIQVALKVLRKYEDRIQKKVLNMRRRGILRSQ
jgi:hypothetical protein